MIAGDRDGDSMASETVDFGGRLSECSGQRGILEAAQTLLERASRDVDRHSLCSKRKGDSLAHAPARAGDHGNLRAGTRV